MSITQTLGADMASLVSGIYSEQNPVERLILTRYLEKQLTDALRKLKQESAYDARQTMSSVDIADALECDRKAIDYLVNCYLKRNPHKPRPSYRNVDKVKDFVNLTDQ